MNKLTGHKDLEPKVLEYLDDRTLFNLLQTHPEYLKKVQGFAEKRVKDRKKKTKLGFITMLPLFTIFRY